MARLEPFDSERWESYPGAYGNIRESLEKMLADPQNKENAENVYQGINYGMDFYRAAYLVLPYLEKLMTERQEDTAWTEYCLFNAATTIASDNIITRRRLKAEQEIMREYRACAKRIAKFARGFYRRNKKVLERRAESTMAKLVFAGLRLPVYVFIRSV